MRVYDISYRRRFFCAGKGYKMIRKQYVKSYSDQVEKGHITTLEAAALEGLQRFDIKGTHGGRVWPSIATLSRKTGISERSLPKQLASLEQKGYITIEHNRGANKTNVYTIITIDIDTHAPYGSAMQAYELEEGETLPTQQEQPQEQPQQTMQQAPQLTIEQMAEELTKHGYIVATETHIDALEAHTEPSRATAEEIHIEPKNEPHRATGQPQKPLDIDAILPAGQTIADSIAQQPDKAEHLQAAKQIINDVLNDNSNRTIYINRQPKNVQTVKAVFAMLTITKIHAAIDRTLSLGAKITNYKALLTSNLYNAAYIEQQWQYDHRRGFLEREEARRKARLIDRMKQDGIDPMA